jgi:hypothetical protein
MILADISSGHTDIADWLFLVAAILFVLEGLIQITATPDRARGSLISAGLALVAIGLLVT